MKLLKLLFLLSSINLFAQEIPRIKLEDSTFLALKQLDVKTEVVGNITTTTYKMKFYNLTNRVLEGELAFPLGQGQSVTNFAMDVNGKMRDAVIVEKELGRIAYESTVRQTIDPGLLEITKGNNYKARVYPIPANGFKMVEVTFEEELKASNNRHIYHIPFSFNEPLDFSFGVEVFNINQSPKIIEGKKYGLKFIKSEYTLKAFVKKIDYAANQSFKLELPIMNKESVSTYSNYFNIYKAFEPKTRVKNEPNTITILWDASFSMQYRNLKSEMDLLNQYFSYLNNVKVDLIIFNNSIQEKVSFDVKNGNWKTLKSKLNDIVYDGGTSYLDFPKITSDEILFFTDGMLNLGEFNLEFKGKIYAINAVNSANHEYLSNLSSDFNGKYINLKSVSSNHGLEYLSTQSFKFLGYSGNKNIEEVYPKKYATVNTDFSISGRFNKNTKLELLFGYGNEITERIEVYLEVSNFNSLVKRLWAKKKLNHLNKNKEENKADIIDLGSKYHLITDFTSMIILDRLEDYIRYKIEPPAELKSSYKERMADIKSDEEERLNDIIDRKEELLDDYIELKDWYNTKYPILNKTIKKKPESIQEQVATQNPENTQSETIINPSQKNVVTNNSINNPAIDTNRRVISGTILDNNNLPLPGATVVIQGTSTGVSTDFDGNYAINAEVGDVLNISYVGYASSQVTVGASNNINSSLEADNALDEVVVTAMGIKRESRSISYSVQTVSSESVTDVVQSLSGKVAGVQISNANGSSGASPNLIIRGNSTLNGESNPLYVIDGKVVTNTEFENIDTDDIHSLTVLKDATANSLYGNRASNGVIIIATKEGLQNNNEAIKQLTAKIQDDIQFKPWSPESDYIKVLQSQNSIENAYEKYLELRVKYRNTPVFFIDVADFFDSKNNKELAIKVLTNLSEIDLDNHEILRALAYKLEYFKQYKIALHINKEILKLRPEEPQSRRDLALAYENIGDYQKAFDLLSELVDGKLIEKDLDERFYGIEHIALIEAGHLLRKFGKKIKLTKNQRKLIFPVDVDLRIVADWNHNDTDLDLWVDNPKEQSISYKNRITDYGDRLSEDMTEGYGPEEYLIKRGLKGVYEIEIDYYADNVQKISGPTILKITIFKNYGKSSETKEVRILRLKDEEDIIEIGSVKF